MTKIFVNKNAIKPYFSPKWGKSYGVGNVLGIFANFPGNSGENFIATLILAKDDDVSDVFNILRVPLLHRRPPEVRGGGRLQPQVGVCRRGRRAGPRRTPIQFVVVRRQVRCKVVSYVDQ